MPLGKRTDYGDAKFAGVEVPFASDIVQTLKVVGRISPWIDPDSPNAAFRQDSCAALRQELAWAAHLGLQACIVPTPPRPMSAHNYAQILNQALAGLSHMSLWVRIPLAAPGAHHADAPVALDGGTDGEAGSSSKHDAEAGNPGEYDPATDPWEWWHLLRTLCEHHHLLGVLLEVPEQLPSNCLISRWLGEPVKALVVSTSLFTLNKRMCPTLPKRHQQLLASFFKHNVQVIVSGNSQVPQPPPPPPPPPGGPAGPLAATDFPPLGAAPPRQAEVDNPGLLHPLHPYWEYMAYLFRKLEDLSPQEVVEASYRDHLQSPLQPLQDNLESQTYETFEKDSTKYEAYGAAVHAALLDRVPQEQAADTVTVLMVVGAGRGPLVRASLNAGVRAGRKLRVYAVEKNPNAVVTIQHLIHSEGWQDRVTLVACDMRFWQAPEQADILVSELLGSFGDNELSPECLDGAQRFLKPDGISIPASYTSWLAPMAGHKLHVGLREYKDVKHFETPYVVKLHNVHLLAAPQPVFTFTHPNRAQPIDNTRCIHMTFRRAHSEGAGVVHGFAGYFETVLYGSVNLSTNPSTHTPGMFSWFPIYFPLREPMYVPPGADLQVSMWRNVGAHKVWYEWAVTSPTSTNIHNVGGRSYYVGL